MSDPICKLCHKPYPSYKALKSHWYDDHSMDFKRIENWLEKDVDELRRLEHQAQEGLKGHNAGATRRDQ